MPEGIFKIGRCRIIITKDPDKDFPDGAWHLSISTENALPSYKEMKKARYKLLPDKIYMAEIFPPQNEFVNLHQFTRHLFQIDIERSNMPVMKTSVEWWHNNPLSKTMRIFDPDGWDRANFQYSFYEEPINYDEFYKRLFRSALTPKERKQG